jgi:hypothetical protein
VYIDPQSGFRALKNLFPGVLIDDGGASDYVPKVDSKIKRIKELYHAVKNGLPWRLPTALIKHLVCYAVGRMNICRTSSITSNLSPYNCHQREQTVLFRNEHLSIQQQSHCRHAVLYTIIITGVYRFNNIHYTCNKRMLQSN